MSNSNRKKDQNSKSILLLKTKSCVGGHLTFKKKGLLGTIQ